MNAAQKRIWDEVVERDDGICLDCGKQACEVHHVIPRQRPWAWRVENMLCLCEDCHKGDRNAHTHVRRVGHLRLLAELYGYDYSDGRWREWAV